MFLKAFCAYMEGVADGIRMWFGIVACALVLIAVCSVFSDVTTPQQMAHVVKWAVVFGAVGIFTPKSGTWDTWYYMIKIKDKEYEGD